MTADLIPAEAEADLREMLESGRAFHVEFDGKDGRINSWKVTLFGRASADWAPARSLTIRKRDPQIDRDRRPLPPSGPR